MQKSRNKNYLLSVQLQEIRRTLKQHADDNGRKAIQKFIPGVFKFYGARTPLLNDLAKEFKKGGFPLAEELWDAAYWEEKILAAKLLGKIAKQDAEKTLELFEKFSATITDWAVCDALGMQSLHPIRKTNDKEIFAIAKKLNQSENLWQRRLSLVMVEWYTRDVTKHTRIKNLVKALETDEEYYVKKAIVWINKNFDKRK